MENSLKRLELEISNPCNEKCLHCYRTGEQTKDGFLSLGSVKKIFSDISQIRSSILDVLLTGGEALLNKEWRQILAFCLSQDCRVSLFSNGTMMTDMDLSFLKDCGKSLKEVQLSLYSLDPNVHDAVTKLPGSFKKTWRVIEKMHEMNLPVFVSCPAMKKNIHTVAEEMRRLDANGIPSCVDLLIFPNSDFSRINDFQRLTRLDLEMFFNETKKNFFELGYVWGENHLDKVDINKAFYGVVQNTICVAGDGSIYPTVGWYKKLGSIFEKSVADVFCNDPFLNECRSIKISDISDCCHCDSIGFCPFCPYPHINANNGELRKLDKSFCEYVHMVKEFAELRDFEISRSLV